MRRLLAVLIAVTVIVALAVGIASLVTIVRLDAKVDDLEQRVTELDREDRDLNELAGDALENYLAFRRQIDAVGERVDAIERCVPEVQSELDSIVNSRYSPDVLIPDVSESCRGVLKP
jgi:hypothetical protein